MIKTISVVIVLTLVLIFIYIKGYDDSFEVYFKKPVLIAHASGGINGLTYLNSLQALNRNYALGHRYFEVDFNWAADDKLVLIHDWGVSYKRLFGIDTQSAPTEREFLNLTMNYGQTQLSLTMFAEWMDEHENAIVIADIKHENIKGLTLLLSTIKKPFNRIIPQLYKTSNYKKIKDLGFSEHNILFTMYRTLSLKDEIEFIENNNLFAISIQPQKPYFENVLRKLGDSKIMIYILTSNNIKGFEKLKKKGVDGLVTDFIYQNQNELLLQNTNI